MRKQADTDYTAEVERVRAERDRVTAARAAIARHRVPRETAIARMKAHVRVRAAALVPPDPRGYCGPDYDAVASEGSVLYFEQPDAVDCWRDPDRVLAHMVAALDRYLAADPAPTLTEAERVRQLAALDRKLLDLEIEEERIFRAAEADGRTVDRREEAEPVVVLARDLGRVAL